MPQPERRPPVQKRVPYDADRSSAAMSAKRVYDDFLADRRAAVCRAKDPDAFAADPGSFVYTADHCHAKKGKGSASDRLQTSIRGTSASSDAKDIRAIQAIVDLQYPKLQNDRQSAPTKTPGDEVDVPHETILQLTGFMMMPYYRTRYPDPDARYAHILKVSKTKTNPRFRVMSQVLMFLKAYRASPTAEKIVKLKASKAKRA